MLFFSDNGGVPPSGSSKEPLRGRKHTFCERGIRVAAAARWLGGGISGGGRIDSPISVVDVFSTLARLAGIDEQAGSAADGEDARGTLRGGTAARGDFEFYGYFNGKHIPGNDRQQDAEPRGQAAVNAGDRKPVRLGPNLDPTSSAKADSTSELFRLRTDPNESIDLSTSRPDTVDRLHGKLLNNREFELDGPPTIPLFEPYGWSRPEYWRITR